MIRGGITSKLPEEIENNTPTMYMYMYKQQPIQGLVKPTLLRVHLRERTTSQLHAATHNTDSYTYIY